MRLTLCAIGSRGDVAPFLALGRALDDAGSDVVLTAPPEFAGEAADAGLEFRPIAPSGIPMFQAATAATGSPLRMMSLLSRAMRVATIEVLDELPAIADGSDVLVATGIVFAAPHVAEALGIAYRNVSFCPRSYPSACQPTFADPASRRPRLVNALAWQGLEANSRLLLGGVLSRWRRDHGLPPVSALYSRMVGLPGERLLAADEELAPLPQEVEGATQVSAICPPQTDSLSREVEGFLASGDPPVFFGFGSAVARDTARLLDVVLESTGALGLRSIVPAAWVANRRLPDDCLSVEYVPHNLLFRRVAAVVHHGGAGTTTTAARAGVPQLVVPVMMDQHYWGLRVCELGIGPKPLGLRRLSSAALASALREILDSPSMTKEARLLSARSAGRDGAAELVGVLCRVSSARAAGAVGGEQHEALGPSNPRVDDDSPQYWPRLR